MIYPHRYIRLGDSGFQQTKERWKEPSLLIYSGLDTGSAFPENALVRWGMVYEKREISLEEFLEDPAGFRDL